MPPENRYVFRNLVRDNLLYASFREWSPGCTHNPSSTAVYIDVRIYEYVELFRPHNGTVVSGGLSNNQFCGQFTNSKSADSAPCSSRGGSENLG